MSTTVDVQTPESTAPAAEQSIDDIVKAALASAEADGTQVVEPEDKTPVDKPAAAPAAADPPAETPKTEEPKADEISAARARKILEQAEAKLAEVEERGRALTEREAASQRDFVEQLLKAPKSFLAKYGRHIDDLIDASVAEGKEPDPAKVDDDRLTKLEQRLEREEQERAAARDQAAIDAKVAEIHRDVKASAKFPLVNEVDGARDVTDFMVEYFKTHGKPIQWEKAAALVEADLRSKGERVAKKLGWTPPAAAKPAEPAKERPGTTSISGESRTAAPSDEDLPEDPEKLMAYLVSKASNGLLKTA